jgi:putative ABC transport system permease protein
MTSYVSGKALVKDFPQIERMVYAFRPEPVVMQNGEAAFETISCSSTAILRRPPFPSSAATAHRARRSARVLTETEAIKRFGTDNVARQTLTMIRGQVTRLSDHRRPQDLPKNSHIEAHHRRPLDPETFNADPARISFPAGAGRAGWSM